MHIASSASSTTLPEDSNPDGDDMTREFGPLRTHTNAFSRPQHTSSNSQHALSRQVSQKEPFDPHLDIELPYRTLSANANLDEYRIEAPGGSIPGPIEPESIAGKSGQHDGTKRRYKLVTFTPNDLENPKNWSKAYKWWCTLVVASTCFVVAFSSAVTTADVVGVAEEFNVSTEAALVTISVFVVGKGRTHYIHSTLGPSRVDVRFLGNYIVDVAHIRPEWNGCTHVDL
ncbi:hypothetical protein EDB81DRAFT_949630 [Dactylonectria macrodidyma]|uniref:Uncharacterized protein n=1 Tax=Dactylonectria macrodidyma TaxID=307937 RepID=A0A9P9EBT5_9HYPO|nr:hypothetical protein EDB81DRAFT_949630 [Dactylonectria macrodidyma]